MASTNLSTHVNYSTAFNGPALTLASYIETIELIYSEKTFTFNSPDPLIDLRATILPSRLCAIRSLSFSTRLWLPLQPDVQRLFPKLIELPWPLPPYDFRTWVEACNVIAQMPGIRDLHILLDSLLVCLHSRDDNDDDCQHIEEQTKILEPLCKIRGASSFTITVDWYNRIPRLPDAPFEVIYRSLFEDSD